MLKGFKNFILKGNVVDMAVGVVVGVAFGTVITAMVKDLVMPLIGVVGGTHDFSAIYFTVNGSKFMIGDFINSLISFLSISAVIYFLVIVPMNKIMKKMEAGKPRTPLRKPVRNALALFR